MAELVESVFNQKDEFYNKLRDYYSDKPGKRVYTRQEQQEIIKEIQAAKLKKGSKTRREYFLLQTYDVLSVGGEHFLLKANNEGNASTSDIKYVVAYEDLYERLYDIHVNCTGHGGHLKMRQTLNNKFSIPRPAVEHFLATCQSCNKKKGLSRKNVVRPITSKDFNERGQVDLIDFQSLPDGPYRWILNYQDHSTKFICLRALQHKTATEVAKELLQIFLTFGAPKILQSDNGREFVNYVINELKLLWPDCIIVNGRPRHPQSQGSVERCNQDVENMLRSWMTDNNSKSWSIGIQFVQWQKNISYHRIIGRSPYRALFGGEPRIGLASSNIPNALLSTFRNEEDIEALNEQQTEAHVKTNTNMDSEPVLIVVPSANEAASIAENNEIDWLNIPSHQSQPLEEEDGRKRVDSNESTPAITFCNNTLTFVPDSLINPDSDSVQQLALREQEIQNERCAAHAGQKRGAEEMLKFSKTKKQKFTKDNCVLLAVPKVDRGPADSSNLVAVVIDIQNGVYQVATPHGIIKGWFGNDSLQKAASNFIGPNEIDTSKFISLREAISKTSGGQGFFKCSCKASKTQCNTKRCVCFKMKTLCNSRCHSSLSCVNKG